MNHFPSRQKQSDKPTMLQPDLRAYIIYDHIPAGHTAFELPDDSCAPHIRPEEFAIIDTSDRKPMNGELFLVQFQSSNRQEIVETSMWSGSTDPCWWLHSYNRPRSLGEISTWIGAGRTNFMSDGPYPSEGPNSYYLDQLIIGRVVGILEMDFRKRIN